MDFWRQRILVAAVCTVHHEQIAKDDQGGQLASARECLDHFVQCQNAGLTLFVGVLTPSGQSAKGWEEFLNAVGFHRKISMLLGRGCGKRAATKLGSSKCA